MGQEVMEMLLWFDAIGDPCPEPRPRWDGRKGVYVPSKATPWKHEIRAACKAAQMRCGWVGVVEPGVPLAVGLEFRMARPKSHWRQGRHSGKLKDHAPYWHTGKPDIDNLTKAALDAVGAFDGCPTMVWADDSQVVTLDPSPLKRYAQPGEEPGCRVSVFALSPLENPCSSLGDVLA
jgi:Holliday junction resolvase RusA-like endonuclease